MRVSDKCHLWVAITGALYRIVLVLSLRWSIGNVQGYYFSDRPCISMTAMNRISLGIYTFVCFCGIIKSKLSDLSGQDVEQSEVMMAASQMSYFKILSNVLKCI